MKIQDVLREMRSCAASDWAKEQGEVDDLNEWANAVEQAMREPAAELVRTSTGSEWAFRLMDPPIGTKLFAFPPSAQAEIEQLREALEKIAAPCYGPDPSKQRRDIARAALAATEDQR